MFENRYFYSVEDWDETEGKRIHMFGNMYDNEDGRYMYAEWVGEMPYVSEVNNTDKYLEELMKRVKYLGDLAPEKLSLVSEAYFIGNSKYLDLKDVNRETPVGDYYFDRKLDGGLL